MPNEPSVLGPELESHIREILETCRTHMASISIRTLRNDDIQTEHEMRTLVASRQAGHEEYTVSTEGKELFHIASITKILVAVAVIIAVEVKAVEDRSDNPYDRFKDIQNVAVTKLYNQYNEARIGGLRGNPTIYNLLVHSYGLPSTNQYMLGPAETPIMLAEEVPKDLLRHIAPSKANVDTYMPKTQYSNTNYSVVAMIIETLWGGGLDTFMNETLFRPLGMKSTSIGFPSNRNTEMNGWVVDSKGESHEIIKPRHLASGAEAGALGAYSTAEDLDIFYKFLLDSFHQREVIEGVDLEVIGIMTKMTMESTNAIDFTPLGLYTTLDTSTVGAMSVNRRQFPDKHFSTYPVMPGSSGKESGVFTMAGSAIGCYCATAFCPSKTKENFSVVVLTDTSGPVDSADHILRLILQNIAQRRRPDSRSRLGKQPEIVGEMAKQAMAQSLKEWEKAREADAKYIGKAPRVDRNIVGVFKEKDVGQRLYIHKEDDGKTYMTVGGSTVSLIDKPCELVWIDQNSLKMCIPQHLSIDTLVNCDWSNLVFNIKGQDHMVQELTRKVGDREDHFVRVAS